MPTITPPAHEDYETPANGATLTTANTWANFYSGTAQTCSTAQHKNGTKSAHVDTTGGSASSLQGLVLNASVTSLWLEFFVMIPTLGTQFYIASCLDATGKIADVRVNTNGSISIRNLNTLVDTSTTLLTAGVWHRIAWHVDTVAHSQELYIYADTDVDNPQGSSTEPALTGAINLGGAAPPVNLTQFNVGITIAAISEVFFDYVQVGATEQGSPTPSGGGGGGGGGTGGGGATDFLEDFEGAANNVALTNSTTGFDTVTGATAHHSTDFAMNGTRSAHLDTTGGAGNTILTKTLAAAKAAEWTEVYFLLPALGIQCAFINSWNGATKIGEVRINADGTFSLKDNSTIKTGGNGVMVAQPGVWHRLAYLANPGGGVQRLRLYLNSDFNNANGAFSEELVSTTTGTAQTLVNEIHIGIIQTTTFEMYLDYFQMGTSEPTPLGTAGGSGPGILAAPSFHITLVVPSGDIGLGSVMNAPPFFITLKGKAAKIVSGGGAITVGQQIPAPPFFVTLTNPVPALVGQQAGTVYTTPQTGRSGFRSDFPLNDVIAAITAPTTRITRRVAIYEADGETLWDGVDDTPRLIDGAVSVDYSRAERRALDVTLDNADGALFHDPSGFWYDKVIKAYRGIEYDDTATIPKILVIEDANSRMRSFLRNNLGYPLVDINTLATSVADLYGYDIIVSDSYTGASTKSALLAAAYQAGYKIFTTGLGNDETTIPWVVASIAKTTGTWQIDPAINDSPLAGGWGSNSFTGNTSTGRLPSQLDVSATPVGTYTYSATLTFVSAVAQNTTGGSWFNFQPNQPWNTATPSYLIKRGIDWLFNYTKRRNYETQLGEFYIDNIDEARFPKQIKVTARDAVKKMLNSKFSQALAFSAGTSLDLILKALAANSGIYKTLLDTGGAILGADVAFDRTTERWKAVADLCAAANLEVFMNPSGYLTSRPFFDPVTSPVSMQFATGDFGNLVDFKKSSNDSRIYNHIVVSAESGTAISSGDLFFAEAFNNEPTSPTRIDRLGERTYFYTSSFFTNQQQCQDYADSLLKIAALEEYVLDLSSLVFPWLEVGEIIEFLDDAGTAASPSRFLLDTLSIPLSLSPMAATGKRVTIVGGVG